MVELTLLLYNWFIYVVVFYFAILHGVDLIV